jgi:glycosyltransferase involved in cell wall biosynthesis
MSSSNLNPVGRRKPRLLFIDSAYTLKMVFDRALQEEFLSRNCGGYFEHVWGIHPFADIPEKRQPPFRGFEVTVTQFSEDQTIVEGLSAYYRLLRRVFPLNFVVSQLRFLAHIAALVRREDISIVLSSDPYFSGLLALGVKLLTGRPVVIWVVANYDDIYRATGKPNLPRMLRWRWLEKRIERFVLRRADLVAGANQDNLDFALRNGARHNHSTVFAIGKLIHRQHLLDPALRPAISGADPARIRFVFVGRLAELKHVDDLLRAIDLIRRRVPKAELLIAGDGPLRSDLEAMATDMDLAGHVRFVGNLDQESLANVLASCFAALSTLTGRSLIEVTLAGLPVVAYDRDWQRSFLEPANAGIVVPFRDWSAMADAAVRLVEHPEEAKAMSEAARRLGLKTSDRSVLFAHEQRQYDALLARTRKSTPSGATYSTVEAR